MVKLELELTDAQTRRLGEAAARLGLTPKELISAVVSDLLQRPGVQFQEAAEKVLAKNAELHRRLA